MRKHRQIISIELWKAFHNTYFWIAMGVGLIIVYFDVRENYYSIPNITQTLLESIEMGLPISGFQGCSLFLWWISSSMNEYSSLFYQLFPILAAMPFGWSFSMERRNGLMVQYAIRSGRSMSLFSKFCAVFISGGLVVSVPVLVDLLLNALICPSESLLFFNPITMIFSKTFLSNLFFTHPWIWSFIWCTVDFIWGGASAVLCFLGGTHLRFPSIVILLPYIVYYILAVATNILTQLVETDLMLDPFYATMAMSFGPVPAWWIFSVTGAFSIISWSVSYFRVMRNDLL